MPGDGDPWLGCQDPAVGLDGALCVTSGGDRQFHAFPISIPGGDPADFDSGVFGISVKPVRLAEQP